MTLAEQDLTISAGELLEMKMLLEDEDDHTYRLLEIISTVSSRPVQSEQSIRQDIPDCPYHKYQCHYEFNGKVTPEQHLCKKEGKADCEFMIWFDVNGSTHCTRGRKSIRQDEREKVLDALIKRYNEIDPTGTCPLGHASFEFIIEELRKQESKQ